jgi:hypothetical protein
MGEGGEKETGGASTGCCPDEHAYASVWAFIPCVAPSGHSHTCCAAHGASQVTRVVNGYPDIRMMGHIRM